MKEIKLVTQNLHKELNSLIKNARGIFFLVSFIMDSGIDQILPLLKEAYDNNIEIKILTGDYLYLTQPNALQKLISLGEEIELRLFLSGGRSFHPKVYAFENFASSSLVIGSSNLSKSALTSGIEWNMIVHEEAPNQLYNTALDKFLKLFYHDQTIPLNRETLIKYTKDHQDFHSRNINFNQLFVDTQENFISIDDLDEEPVDTLTEQMKYIKAEKDIAPHSIQQEALDALHTTMQEGYESALVVMATGLGKTYLSAFLAKNFSKILFIAHRKEILIQAKKSYDQIFSNKNQGLFIGKTKEPNNDQVFASIQTLSLRYNINEFDKDEFDLIIIDEFHHAAAKTYQRVIDYFNPKFMLGLTATPDRMDGKDIYNLCEGNLAYQIDFFEAIDRGYLVPFEYFGVYDEIDYSEIRSIGKTYDKGDLFNKFVENNVAEKILDKWNNYHLTKSLGFCSSVKQSDYLAEYFERCGVSAISLTGNSLEELRNSAIQALEDGRIEIIFTVDLFNEGIDIPTVDTLLFIRPTESLTVFIQQLGRGLRLSPNKDFCRVIDLTGNYRNVDVKLEFLGINDRNIDRKDRQDLPKDCKIEFDLEFVNLYKELASIKKPRKIQMSDEFFDLKLELGKIPTYLQIHLMATPDVRILKQEWGSYIGFLEDLKQLSEFERQVYLKYKDFIELIESTSMVKSYKMIVLDYMLSRGKEKWFSPTNSKDSARYFHEYLTSKPYRQKIDFNGKKHQKMFQFDMKKVSRLIANMPMEKMAGSSGELILYNKQDDVFEFNIGLTNRTEESDVLYNWLFQICQYRLHYHFEKKLKKKNNTNNNNQI